MGGCAGDCLARPSPALPAYAGGISHDEGIDNNPGVASPSVSVVVVYLLSPPVYAVEARQGLDVSTAAALSSLRDDTDVGTACGVGFALSQWMIHAELTECEPKENGRARAVLHGLIALMHATCTLATTGRMCILREGCSSTIGSRDRDKDLEGGVLTGLKPFKSTTVKRSVHPHYRNFASREWWQLLGQAQQILPGVVAADNWEHMGNSCKEVDSGLGGVQPLCSVLSQVFSLQPGFSGLTSSGNTKL
ncbi:hypothetical protein DFH08DRAFT_817122 [Mycena albidolilacea]|uniref:Uncharacterized protein n=1 Tax=Mycena albidolilacea TaxID=1033008 RepID=A0AAD6ZIY4_9AGAR|nr:hypothetical protein DFH08DRAFT_817122 [Mycena albidolilacea]